MACPSTPYRYLQNLGSRAELSNSYQALAMPLHLPPIDILYLALGVLPIISDHLIFLRPHVQVALLRLRHFPAPSSTSENR